MLEVLAALCLFQRLDPEPYVAHPDQEVTVRATDREARPCAGVALEVVDPAGKVFQVGKTDAKGRVTFVVRDVGLHELRGTYPEGSHDAGLVVFATYHVVASPRRWLYALVLTPLGLLLLVWNLRLVRDRLRESRNRTDDAATPGPSPPAA